MTPISHGYKISDVVVPPQAFTAAELEDAMYRLTADPDQDALLLESCDLEEADALMNPGQDMVVEAVTAVKNRLDRTMNALVRVFRRYSSSVEPHEYPSIGPDRRNALFAYKTVTFTFKDGQTVSILFHSPGRDPMKLRADDTLIAYRWMLNRRDITATVAPERGRDINLQTMARRIMQLVEDNSERFQANNQARQEQQEKLAELEGEQQEVTQRVEALTQQNADLTGSIETADERIARLRERLAAMGEDEREGSGAGTGSTGTPAAATDVAKGVAARAGLEALRLGRGHRVDGIEYNKTGEGTEVIIGGQVAAVVKGRLSKSSVELALTKVAGDTMADSLESFGEALKSQLNLPEGHSLEFEAAAEIKRRADTIGAASASENVYVRRDAGTEGGYSGQARLIINDRRAEVAIFLTNEATGVTEDRATIINGDNLSQLVTRTAEYLNGKFGAGQADEAQGEASTLTADSVSDALLEKLKRDNEMRVFISSMADRYSEDDYEDKARNAAESYYSRIGIDGMPEGARDMPRAEKVRVQRAFIDKATSYLLSVMQEEDSADDAANAERVRAFLDRVAAAQTYDALLELSRELGSMRLPDDSRQEIEAAIYDRRQEVMRDSRRPDEPSPESGRVAEYLARVEAAQTAQEVSAIANEFEHDTDIQGDDFTRVNDAIRERRTAIAQAASQAKIDSPEMAEVVEKMMTALRDSTELHARIRREVPGRDASELTPEAFRGFARNWFDRNEEAVLGELGTTIPIRPEVLDQFADQAAPYIAELAQEFAASGGDGLPDNLEALDGRVYRDMVRSIAEVRSIDNGDSPMNRSAFTTSMANRLRTQARNGNTEVVDAALLLLAEQSLAHGRPILAARNRIWSATGNDMDYYMEIARRRAEASAGADTGTPGGAGSDDFAPGFSSRNFESQEAAEEALTAAGYSHTDTDESGARFFSASGRNEVVVNPALGGQWQVMELDDSSGDPAPDDSGPTEQDRITADLTALIDTETDARAFDERLTDLTRRAEEAGAMEALMSQFNQAADRLDALLDAAEQGGGSAGGDAGASGSTPAGGDQPASEQQQIEDGLQALIDNESDASAFDTALDEWAERAEAAGLMDALDAKLNEAADRLTTLLNEEAARVA